ncbi:TPA: hypothetical protein DIC38_02110 [Candidatus Nomurabacteria bacterium]|nr:MAG: hypothetical protein O210_OD1C00001G0308 [Parcubacteria bacterium RAAC4_OD1_1]HCY26451.1 hypothetical protein [Candidatus Nomurabacteria bacterium]
MYKYIQKVKEKNESARKRVLAKWMFVSVFVVVGAWALTVSSRFNNSIVAKNEVEDNSPKPFVLFKDSISSTYKNVLASVGNIEDLKDIKREIKGEEKMIELIPVEYNN